MKTAVFQFFQNAWQTTWAVLDQHSLTLYEQTKGQPKGHSEVKVSEDQVQGCYMVDQMAFVNTVETSGGKSHLVICTKQNLRLEFVGKSYLKWRKLNKYQALYLQKADSKETLLKWKCELLRVKKESMRLDLMHQTVRTIQNLYFLIIRNSFHT